MSSNLLVKVVCVVNGGGCAKRFDFFFYLEKKILDLYIFFPFSARWSKLKLVAMVIFFIWNLFPNIGAFLFLIWFLVFCPWMGNLWVLTFFSCFGCSLFAFVAYRSQNDLLLGWLMWKIYFKITWVAFSFASLPSIGLFSYGVVFILWIVTS